MRVAFGPFVLDSDARSLVRNGAPIDLTPKAFRLLTTLLERHPRAAAKRELIDALWPDVTVVEGNLANLVAELRAAIDDASARSWIRTVRRFGYAFAGDLIRTDGRRESAASEFQLRLGDREFRLSRGINSLGRSPDSVVPMRSRGVSRHHAQILVTDGKAVLQDLGSRNGTFVRGERIRSSAELREGDTIVLGSEVAGVVEIFAPPGSTHSLRG